MIEGPLDYINGWLKPRRAFRKCGVGVNISKLTYIRSVGKVSCGNYIYIGPFGKISATGGLTIGNNVSIAFDVIILTTNHNYDSKGMKFIPYDSKLIKSPVTIEDNVFIGSRVIILPGVKIGKGSVVGAGSVVTKNVKPYSIVGGNPAKIIRNRRNLNLFRSLEDKKRLLMKFEYKTGKRFF